MSGIYDAGMIYGLYSLFLTKHQEIKVGGLGRGEGVYRDPDRRCYKVYIRSQSASKTTVVGFLLSV